MLGVIIGVAAVIVTSRSASARASRSQRRSTSLGQQPAHRACPASVTHDGARTGFGGASTLTPADGMAIAQLPGVASVTPTVDDAHAGRRRQRKLADHRQRGRADVHLRAQLAALRGIVLHAERRRERRESRAFSDRPSPRISSRAGRRPSARPSSSTACPSPSSGPSRALGQSGIGPGPRRHRAHPVHLRDAAPHRANDGERLDVSAANATDIDAVQSEITTLLEQRHRIVAQPAGRLSSAQSAGRRRRRLRDRRRSWSSCSPASRPSRSSSAASAS